MSDRVRPQSPGLRSRMWHGGGSVRSTRWAVEHGMTLLSSNVVRAEESQDFAAVQLSHMQAFRDHPPRRRGGADLAGSGGDPHRQRDGGIDRDDYVQILNDIAGALGWQPPATRP